MLVARENLITENLLDVIVFVPVSPLQTQRAAVPVEKMRSTTNPRLITKQR